MEEEEYEERNYYEIQLNNRQLVLVFIGTIVIGLVIFVLGVNVGKSKKEIEFTSLGSQIQKESYRPETTAAQQEQQEVTRAAIPQDNRRWDLTEQKEESVPEAVKKPEDAARPERENKPAPPAAEQERVSPPPASAGQYTVQVASLTSYDDAFSLKQRLASRGYDPIYIVTFEKGNEKYYRVRVGSFSSPRDAGTMAGKLEEETRLNLKTWVCKLDQ